MPRRESWYFQICLPVRGWKAYTPPSPAPNTNAICPPNTAKTGVL